MAFSLNIATGFGDTCDKCGKATDEPLLRIRQHDRDGDNRIWLHESCLAKAIAKAKKDLGNS